MSTTTPNAAVTPDAPAAAAPETEVQKVEQAVENAVPAPLKPFEQTAEEQFAGLEQKVEAGKPDLATAQAADPAIAAAVENAKGIADGQPVTVSNEIKVGKGVVAEVKAGYKTTEFWGSAAIIVLTQVGAINVPGKYGETITTAATAVAYVLSRGLAKYGKSAS